MSNGVKPKVASLKKPFGRDARLITLLVLLLVLSLFLSCLLGATPLGAGRVLGALFGQGNTGDILVVWQIRLPRAVAALLVGLALGTSGAALQGLLRNPLAEPGVLGVSASASLAATYGLYYGFIGPGSFGVKTFSASIGLPIAAIIGALGATLIIAVAAIKVRSIVTLILIGVGLSSFAGAAMSLLLNLAPNPFSIAEMINWTLGSVANRSFEDIYFSAPFIGIGIGILYFSRSGLSALTLGEEAANGVGVNLNRLRFLIILGAGLATGASVALAGAIGFVGIVAPHLARSFVDYDPARALVPSALMAALFLILADIGVRIIPTQNELKLGVVAALIGAPAFVWIAMQRRANHD